MTNLEHKTYLLDTIPSWNTLHYELPMEKKVPWNGAVSMRSRAGSSETFVNLHNATS